MSEPVPVRQTQAGDELLAALAEDFLRRHRAGAHPSVEEYATKHPELADRIRELFPAMMAMEQPGLGPTLPDPAPPAERVGAVVGRYKLLERIGEGGFGVVYMAEQQHPVRRKVALKVIKPGFDSGQVIARFEAERQALALMDHENIARVLDAGATDAGRPYFVMELVHGVPITEYCDKHQLAPRERLELFVHVCRAVQHAHTKGVIHRDIKPTNVLVTLAEGRAVPKVIDFGVAKATGQQLTEKTLFTNFAQMIGTPLYMSPEQAEMTSIDVDTRSDVYSLGVLLYELLTGTTPLDKDRLKRAAFDEVRRIIREEEPPKPSTRLSESKATLASVSAQRHTEPAKLTKMLRGELDWIVMKALEKDRNRRYETANGFASDVRRYLADEPVLAGPPTVPYRFRKFARRHWRVLTVAVAFVMLLASAVVTLSVALVAVNRERHEKEVALEAEGKRRKQARGALDAMSSRVIEYWLAKQTELLPEHRQFLQQALTYYEEFAADTGQGEEARAGVAHAYGRVGIIRSGLGHYQEAEAAWRRSGELYAGLAADFPTHPGYQGDLAQTQYQLGRLLHTTGRPREAEAAYTQALTIQQQLVGDVPTRAEFRLELAKSYYLVGVVLAETGRATESEVAQTHGRKILEQLARDYPTRPEFRKELGACYIAFGVFLKNNGRPQESAEAVRQAVAIYEKLATDFPAVPLYRFWLVQAYISFGNLLQDISRSSQAQEAYGQAVTISRQLAADFPTVPDYRDALTRSLHCLGDVFRISNRFDEAEQAYREVLTIRKQLAADFPAVSSYRQTLAVTLNNLGILLKNTGRAADAEDSYRQATAIHKQLAAEFPAVSDYQNEVAGGMVNLARLLLARKELDGARRLLEDALPYHQSALKVSPHNPEYRKFYRNNRWRLTETLLELNDHAAAAETAGQFLEAAVDPPRDAYTTACLLAGCVRLAAQDEGLTDSKRQELTTTYGDRAVTALRQAFERGANELARMKDDPNLDPLRHRQDFQNLLKEFEATTQP